MVLTRIELNADKVSELRTYTCAECGHSGTYAVDAGDS